jgi:hypothetical protein
MACFEQCVVPELKDNDFNLCAFCVFRGKILIVEMAGAQG